MATVYPLNATVRILLGESAVATALPLPMPNFRDLKWVKVVEKETNVKHQSLFTDLGYSATLDLEFVDPSDTVRGYLSQLYASKSKLTVFPFYIGSTIPQMAMTMKLTKAEIVGLGQKNVNHKYVMTLEATQLYSQPFNIDDATLLQMGKMRYAIGTGSNRLWRFRAVRNTSTGSGKIIHIL
jgi:hypothetical protein